MQGAAAGWSSSPEARVGKPPVAPDTSGGSVQSPGATFLHLSRTAAGLSTRHPTPAAQASRGHPARLPGVVGLLAFVFRPWGLRRFVGFGLQLEELFQIAEGSQGLLAGFHLICQRHQRFRLALPCAWRPGTSALAGAGDRRAPRGTLGLPPPGRTRPAVGRRADSRGFGRGRLGARGCRCRRLARGRGLSFTAGAACRRASRASAAGSARCPARSSSAKRAAASCRSRAPRP